MSWLKIDDGFSHHPKILSVSIAARWAYLEALCYSAQYLTDGKVADGKLKLIASPKVMNELTDANLWHRTANGIAIHDYLDYNPSCEEVTKHKQEISKVRSKAGSKGAAKRWQADD